MLSCPAFVDVLALIAIWIWSKTFAAIRSAFITTFCIHACLGSAAVVNTALVALGTVTLVNVHAEIKVCHSLAFKSAC